MKLILQSDVEKLGEQGDLVEVAAGYGRNYLLPKGLAVTATPANLKQVEALRAQREERKRREEAEARDLAAKLEGLALRLTARVGEAGRLFGSVTATDIAEAAHAAAGFEIDRRRVELDEPIKQIGNFQVPYRVHPKVVAVLKLEVVAAEEEA
ncbi:MAG TPA: 50S ribosomal protein L9 [Limnochordia bacterium]|nr:50S ribosomal protein L9 [Limnochordia bacterium]